MAGAGLSREVKDSFRKDGFRLDEVPWEPLRLGGRCRPGSTRRRRVRRTRRWSARRRATWRVCSHPDPQAVAARCDALRVGPGRPADVRVPTPGSPGSAATAPASRTACRGSGT
ncbi:hypothetical protein Kpho01_47750 [Kitasatospora phosalacinea]|uniref:Uncharacterized protein n=1 Tax=Kitasatospora phosalacinea TaxID=2065 RepID=A0A9W6PKW6_9ACTN|nr:hypothetical protein Kpho01_47750 [Kitasatospora phosalacinea]